MCADRDKRSASKRKRYDEEEYGEDVDLDLLDDPGDALSMKQAYLESMQATEHDYVKHMKLKADHKNRPIWVCPDMKIFLETFSPVYKQAYDFLIAIAEPVCRSHLVHEYVITPHSLRAAVSVGLRTNEILRVLEKLCKVELMEDVRQFVTQYTSTYGKVKMVLQDNRYFVESQFPEVLQLLLKDEVIKAAKASSASLAKTVDKPVAHAGATQAEGKTLEEDDDLEELRAELEDDEEEESQSFEIHAHDVESVKKACIQLGYPMFEEYDFRNDKNPALAIDLKPSTNIRSYQEKSLSKMFGNGRARSGIIVLPCGAGKTLVGITAACTVKKSTLVLCTSSVSVEQWRNQFLLWSTISPNAITRFTSEHKDFPAKTGIVVSTYTMISYSGKRSDEAAKVMDELNNREWGLILLDEVHVVPAEMFRKTCSVIKAHCKLGLTATLVREDDLITDLNFLIGPKMYEANWLDLKHSGHIANVQCAEVWCPMTAEFYREYLNESSSRKGLLYTMNPNKFHACEFLMRLHEERGDKIIVFADNVFALEMYARILNKPYICGPTSQRERLMILGRFQNDPRFNTIFISKVGDTSIDLPEATVIIQISSHYGSRRQEAQRLGRILRPKPCPQGEFDAFFYSLVSTDTSEMFYSTKRQQYLIDQGYSFKVITDLVDSSRTDFSFGTKEKQLELLKQVLSAGDDAGRIEDLPDDADDVVKQMAIMRAKRSGGTMRELTGADGVKYMEYHTKDARDTRPKKQHHKIFASRYNKKR
eukprot:GFYU01003864.1.p1 GENE.GFYU01003864.1~~GFYU01003864.1.p1  ORF type:complete len:763 (+),score=171.29 GFYU01003864.1:85-2373(+)